jgi:hypothetical protein
MDDIKVGEIWELSDSSRDIVFKITEIRVGMIKIEYIKNCHDPALTFPTNMISRSSLLENHSRVGIDTYEDEEI